MDDDNVIPWHYVQLRIALAERERTVKAYHKAVKDNVFDKRQIIERCQRSDRMVTAALKAYE